MFRTPFSGFGLSVEDVTDITHGGDKRRESVVHTTETQKHRKGKRRRRAPLGHQLGVGNGQTTAPLQPQWGSPLQSRLERENNGGGGMLLQPRPTVPIVDRCGMWLSGGACPWGACPLQNRCPSQKRRSLSHVGVALQPCTQGIQPHMHMPAEGVAGAHRQCKSAPWGARPPLNRCPKKGGGRVPVAC